MEPNFDMNRFMERYEYLSVKNPDGTVNDSKLQELIKKYVELQNNAKKVYSVVTKGLLIDSHYPASTVLSVFENTQKDLVSKDTVCEDMIALLGSDEGTKQLILEYFGKLY